MRAGWPNRLRRDGWQDIFPVFFRKFTQNTLFIFHFHATIYLMNSLCTVRPGLPHTAERRIAACLLEGGLS